MRGGKPERKIKNTNSTKKNKRKGKGANRVPDYSGGPLQ
jgi:hypothetical protein